MTIPPQSNPANESKLKTLAPAAYYLEYDWTTIHMSYKDGYPYRIPWTPKPTPHNLTNLPTRTETAQPQRSPLLLSHLQRRHKPTPKHQYRPTSPSSSTTKNLVHSLPQSNISGLVSIYPHARTYKHWQHHTARIMVLPTPHDIEVIPLRSIRQANAVDIA